MACENTHITHNYGTSITYNNALGFCYLQDIDYDSNKKKYQGKSDLGRVGPYNVMF